MPRHLVTGGAGFIGSHVVDALAARGEPVRVVDDLSTGRRENLAGHPRVELVRGDLADRRVAEAAVAGVDHVVHLAGIPSPARSVSEPRRCHRANVEATHELLLAARDAGVRRVVLASSSSVYGESGASPAHEGLPAAPRSPYALQKLVCEQYAALFGRIHGLETVSLRLFNVFGPRQPPGSEYSGVVPALAAALLAGRPATIHGDGEQTRDFVYVADAARALLLACTAPGAAGRVVNVAGGEPLSVNGLHAALRRATGASARTRRAAPRPGDVRHSLADVSLARDLLGFAPATRLEDGLGRTLDWLRRPARGGRLGDARGVPEAAGSPAPS